MLRLLAGFSIGCTLYRGEWLWMLLCIFMWGIGEFADYRPAQIKAEDLEHGKVTE
jgi:hypothetical protein